MGDGLCYPPIPPFRGTQHPNHWYEWNPSWIGSLGFSHVNHVTCRSGLKIIPNTTAPIWQLILFQFLNHMYIYIYPSNMFNEGLYVVAPLFLPKKTFWKGQDVTQHPGWNGSAWITESVFEDLQGGVWVTQDALKRSSWESIGDMSSVQCLPSVGCFIWRIFTTQLYRDYTKHAMNIRIPSLTNQHSMECHVSVYGFCCRCSHEVLSPCCGWIDWLEVFEIQHVGCPQRLEVDAKFLQLMSTKPLPKNNGLLGKAMNKWYCSLWAFSGSM